MRAAQYTEADTARIVEASTKALHWFFVCVSEQVLECPPALQYCEETTSKIVATKQNLQQLQSQIADIIESDFSAVPAGGGGNGEEQREEGEDEDGLDACPPEGEGFMEGCVHACVRLSLYSMCPCGADGYVRAITSCVYVPGPLLRWTPTHETQCEQ